MTNGMRCSNWTQLGEPELSAIEAATEFFQLDRLVRLEQDHALAVAPSCLFCRSDSVHLLTAAAAAMVNGRGLNIVSCGSAILESGIGKKKAVELQLPTSAGTQAVLPPGGGYVISQAALALALPWITSSKVTRAKTANRVLMLDRQTMLALLQAKRSGEHGGKLKCAPAVSAEAAGGTGSAGLQEALGTQVSELEPGGCVAVYREASQLGSAAAPSSRKQLDQPVALSCWKSDPYWLQISSNDKAALAHVEKQLGGMQST